MAEKTVTQRIDLNELKSGGFIKQTQKDLFTVRLKVPGGRITPEKLTKVAEVAKKYSRMGYCHLSFRQSVEIIGVHIDDFDAVVKELATVGQKVASCGPRVRVPTACGGCEYNPNGIMDAQSKALEVDEKHFGTPCHHKFKMSFSGCPIDCARTRGWIWGFRAWCIPFGAKIYAMDVPCVQRPVRKAQLFLTKKESRCLTSPSACIAVIVSGHVRQMPGRIRRRVGWCVPAGNMEDIRARQIR